MKVSVAKLELILRDKLIEVAGLEEEDATQTAFDVVEQLEEELYEEEVEDED